LRVDRIGDAAGREERGFDDDHGPWVDRVGAINELVAKVSGWAV
jgi:hypothetical protein